MRCGLLMALLVVSGCTITVRHDLQEEVLADHAAAIRQIAAAVGEIKAEVAPGKAKEN